MTSDRTPKYWFRAKRHGWGWGLPAAWQGWVVLVAYVATVLGAIPLVQASRGSVAYLVVVGILTFAFVAVCWRTGEPPRSG